MEQERTSGQAPHGVDVVAHGEVGIVRLRRGPVNALDLAALQRLGEVVGDPATSLPGARAIALVADGPHFSAGHDTAERDRVGEPGYLGTAAQHLRRVLECPLPVVAGVQGSAIGTGLILAACADVMVVEGDARLQLPEVPLGMLGGAGHLLRWLPPATVRHMVLLGTPVLGSQLHPLGLLAPPAGTSAAEHAIELATELAARDDGATVEARDLLDEILGDAASIHELEMDRTAELR